MSTTDQEFLGELRLGRRLNKWYQVSAGGLAILLGLLFVLPIPLLQLDGLGAVMAVLLSFGAIGLTLASVVELLGGAGERGGTYILVYEIMGGAWGFMAGWGMLAGSLGLAAVLIRAAGAHAVLIPVLNELTTWQVSLLLLGLLLLVQLFQSIPYRRLLFPLVVLLFSLFILIVLTAVPAFSREALRAPSAGDGVLYTVAWLTAIFIAFETLLISRRLTDVPSLILPTALQITLGVGLVSMLVIIVFLTHLEIPSGPIETQFSTMLATMNFVPGEVITVLALVGLLLAGNGCLMTAARQLHILSVTGLLPKQIREIVPAAPMPPILFGVLSVTIGTLLFASPVWLIRSAVALIIVALIIVNGAAIYSHQFEPDRRRSFEVPFFPLVPAIAITFNLLLLFALFSADSLVGAAVWLTAGALIYLTYGRTHQLAAQEGTLVFGRTRPEERDEDSYRVLLPIDPDHEQQQILRMATVIAQQRNAELIPLQVIQVPDPLAIEQGRRIARERNALFRWSTNMAVDSGVSTFPTTRLSPRVSEGILDTATEEDCDLVLLPWKIDEEEEQFGEILRTVVRRAPCDVAVLAYRPEREHPPLEDEQGEAITLERIIVPTAGGPHAPLAARLAVSLAKQHGARITILNVVSPDPSADECKSAEEHVKATLATLHEQADDDLGLNDVEIESQIVEADDVATGIANASGERDLILIGASEKRVIEDVVFGRIPEEVARSSTAPVVMVRRFLGLRHLWAIRLWDTVSYAFPQLDGETQIEVYRQLRRNSRAGSDFYIMIGLSTIIATFGLIQSSTAVIIGAMLVAPLFSPILGLSIGMTRGDLRLAQLAFESTIKGIALAIGLAFAFTLLSPLQAPTAEITARTSPSLLDLGVALASGAAGAYASARRDVSAALPGVAIAAALIPPLGVAGFGLATRSTSIAQGSTLLFATNLTAIILAGALTFLLLGFRPGRGEEREARLRTGLMTAGVLLLLISIPLSAVFLESVRNAREQRIVEQAIEDAPGIRLADDSIRIEVQEDNVSITGRLYANQDVTSAQIQELEEKLRRELPREAKLSFIVIPIEEITTP